MLIQAALYSVRWYFENEEFYRYVPKESPPSIVFPVSGITVDVSTIRLNPFEISIYSVGQNGVKFNITWFLEMELFCFKMRFQNYFLCSVDHYNYT